MSTLVEELKKAEDDRQKTKELENTIKELVMQPDVYNTLHKAALNGITAKMNNGFTRLEPKDFSPDTERLGYQFYIEHPEYIKPFLKVHIDLLNNNANVYTERYITNELTKEQIIKSLKTIIGLDNDE